MNSKILSKGAYYIGDPVHVLNYDKWSDFYEKTDNFTAETLELDRVEIYAIDLEYLGITPDFEIKYFTDNNGNKYYVKAGLLGVFPIDKIDANEEEIKKNKYGTLILCDNDFLVEFIDGILKVDNVFINTNE